MIWWFSNRVVAPVMAALLRSPAHPMVSHRLLLVSYEGRRTGRTIRLPTTYDRSGDLIEVSVHFADQKRWWRNFADGHPAQLLVRGEWLEAYGTVRGAVDDPDGPRVAFSLR